MQAGCQVGPGLTTNCGHGSSPAAPLSGFLHPPPLPPAGTGAAAYLALTGDLGASIVAFKAAYPLLVFPAKAAVGFPLIYHYMAGLRHMWWDHAKYGNQADKDSPLEVPAVERSSKLLLGGSAAATALAALYSI